MYIGCKLFFINNVLVSDTDTRGVKEPRNLVDVVLVGPTSNVLRLRGWEITEPCYSHKSDPHTTN